jgi:Carboxypeptidase regulatory-like domain/AMIN domain/TonB dependent receptor
MLEVKAFGKLWCLWLPGLLVSAAFSTPVLVSPAMTGTMMAADAPMTNGGSVVQDTVPTTAPQVQPTPKASEQRVELRELVVVHEPGGIAVKLLLSGSVTPQLSELESPARVVVDLPKTVAVTRQRLIAVGGDGVKVVRVGTDGQVPPTTRVVVDLARPLEYEIVAGSDHNLTLRLHTVPANHSASIQSSDQPKEATHSATEVPGLPSASAQPAERQLTPTASKPTAPMVAGVVEDRTGAVIPGADLMLVELTSNASRNTVSDNLGHFVFTDVPSGHYVLRGKAGDMQNAETDVVVGANAVEVKLLMKVSLEEEITVSAADPVSPDKNSDTVDLSATVLRDLPTDTQNILPLLSNFVAPAAGGTEGISLVVDGAEADQIDDLPASAIKEVATNRNPYGVEFRRPGKARIEITTKHGSRKRYRGHFGIFARDSVLDAKNRFAVQKPDLSRKLFEGSFSGPLGRTGTTFFLSGQHLGDAQSALINATVLNASNQPVSLIQNVPTELHGNDYLARLDFHPGQVHTLTALYNFDEKFESNNGVGGFDLEDRGITTALRGHKFQVTDQALVSPTLLNTSRLLVRRSSSRAGNPPVGYAVDVNGNFSSGPSQTSQRQTETVMEFADSASYAHKHQTFHFGGGTRARLFNLTDQSNFGGTFKFSSLTQFMQGTPYVFSVNQGQPNVTYTIHEANGFIQDEIRFRSTASLVAGLRYDWQSTIANHYGLAPRLALAYSPGDRKTVFRVGGGLFYEYLPQSVTAKALLLDPNHVRQVVISNPSYPDPFSAVSTIPPSVVRIAPDLTTPYLVEVSVSIERELGKRNQLVLECQTLRGVHLFRSRNVNAPLPLTGVRPEPTFFNIDQVQSTASMRDNALTLSYRGEVTKYFKIIAQYSFSKTINDTSGAFSLPADNYDLRPEMGRADFDRRHQLHLAGVFNLPGAFRVGTVLGVASGIPFNITTGADNNHDSVANDRPPGVTRNTGDGPGLLQLDLRLTKLLHVWRPVNRDRDSRNLEISVDAFNAINHTNYPNFVGVMTSPLFGRADTALPARTMQTSLSYRF